MGMMPIVIPTFSKTCTAIIAMTPTQMSVPEKSAASWAVRHVRHTMIENSAKINVLDESEALPLRYPVQLVVRPGTGTDFRGYAGRLASGVLAVGDEVLVLVTDESEDAVRALLVG